MFARTSVQATCASLLFVLCVSAFLVDYTVMCTSHMGDDRVDVVARKGDVSEGLTTETTIRRDAYGQKGRHTKRSNSLIDRFSEKKSRRIRFVYVCSLLGMILVHKKQYPNAAAFFGITQTLILLEKSKIRPFPLPS